jgi:hypothetical protein
MYYKLYEKLLSCPCQLLDILLGGKHFYENLYEETYSNKLGVISYV